MPKVDPNPDEKACAALQISDNLVQDMQGLLLRLHASCDELRELLDRVDRVIGEAHERIAVMASEIDQRRQQQPT